LIFVPSIVITPTDTNPASMDQNRSYGGLVRDILREAEEADQREDEVEPEPEELELDLVSAVLSRPVLARAVVGVSGFGSRAASWRPIAPNRLDRSRVIALTG
jgi:hypothetical protein